VVPTGKTVPDALEQVTGREPTTRSVAVAEYVTVAPDALVAATVWLAGSVSVGFVVSATVTSKVAEPVLPAASVALQVTEVVVIAKVEPEAGLHVTGRLPETLSWAVAVKATTAPSGLVASSVGFGVGSVTVGAVVSTTVTVNAFVVALRALSVAVQLTVAVTKPKVDPDAGAQLTVTGGLMSSVAVASNVTTGSRRTHGIDGLVRRHLQHRRLHVGHGDLECLGRDVVVAVASSALHFGCPDLERRAGTRFAVRCDRPGDAVAGGRGEGHPGPRCGSWRQR
jgi:hypothetical protein